MSRIVISLIAGLALAAPAIAPAAAGECCVPPVVIPAPPFVVQQSLPEAVVEPPVPLYWVNQGPVYSGPGSDIALRFYQAPQPVRDFPYISTVAPAYDRYPPYPHYRYPHRGLRVRG